MLWEGLTLGALARKSAHRRRLGRGPFRRKLVLGGSSFQFFERQRQLLDQARRRLRPLAVDLMLQLGDLQLLLGDQRLVFRRLDRGKFIWPSVSAGAVSISAAQMAYMLEGIDWRKPQLTWRPQSAG